MALGNPKISFILEIDSGKSRRIWVKRGVGVKIKSYLNNQLIVLVEITDPYTSS